MKFVKPLAMLAGMTVAAAAPARAEVAVVVTIKPIHSIVAAVMEGVGEPKLLVTGAASPHTYALKPSDAAAIGKADIFIRVSEDLEPFTRKVVRTLPKKVEVLTALDTPGLKLLDKREGGAFESHDHGKGHSHGSAKAADPDEIDGHIWLDPTNAKVIADAVAEVIARKLPAQADVLRRNAAAFRGKLDALDAELQAMLAPAKGKPFIVFHDAYHYFEQRYGLTAAGSITVNPEVPPSARRLNDLRKKIQGLAAVCIMREPQFEPKVVNSIVQGTSAKVGELDPEGATVEPGPQLYATVMRNLATSLVGCLATSS